MLVHVAPIRKDERQLLIASNGVELDQFLDHGFFTTAFDARCQYSTCPPPPSCVCLKHGPRYRKAVSTHLASDLLAWLVFLSYHLYTTALPAPRPYRPKRRKRKELLTTVTDDSAIAAAAKMGAFSCKNGISGERIAVGMRMIL